MDYKIEFRKRAREEFEFFSKHDKKVILKILKLLEDVKLHPYCGMGKPEQLRSNLTGFWSRRITKEHRLVYKIEGSTIVVIASCRFHY